MQEGGPRVLIGGGADPKLFARIAEYAHGWRPIGGAGMAAELERLRGPLEERGRDPRILHVVPMGVFPTDEKLGHDKEAGVTECVRRASSAGRDEVLPVLYDDVQFIDRSRASRFRCDPSAPHRRGCAVVFRCPASPDSSAPESRRRRKERIPLTRSGGRSLWRLSTMDRTSRSTPAIAAATLIATMLCWSGAATASAPLLGPSAGFEPFYSDRMDESSTAPARRIACSLIPI